MTHARTIVSRSWTRIDGIDLLRGISILFVLMNHINMQLLFAHVPYTERLPHQLASTVAWNGQYGVQIFFAVSGFLITSTALRRWGSLPSLGIADFYRLRVARIAPLLLLLLAVLSALHFAHVKHFVVSKEIGGLPQALFAALTFHINLLEAHRGYLPGNWDILWSLSVEETFYLVFPIAARFLSRGKWLTALFAVLIILGPFARSRAFNHNPTWREYSYLGGMDAIAMGCFTACFLHGRAIQRSTLRWFAAVGAALTIFILCFSIRTYRWGLGRNGLDMSILAVGACLLIAASAESLWRAPRLLAPVLWLGRRSYEIYLTHMFLVIALFAAFVKLGKPLHGVPILFLSVICAAGLLGSLVGRFFSEPANRRLRRNFQADAFSPGSALSSEISAPGEERLLP